MMTSMQSLTEGMHFALPTKDLNGGTTVNDQVTSSAFSEELEHFTPQ